MLILPLDPTFTLSNLITAVESVKHWWGRDRLAERLQVPQSRQGSKDVMLLYFISAVSNASWQTLAGSLYYLKEQTALIKVRSYFKRQPGV